MKYLHIRNLEKYNPGYIDRNLIWCKIYFTMLNSNYEFELIDDIDKWRLIALIMLELQMKKPIPYDEKWLHKKISNNKRPISLTLKVLHNFIDIVTEDDEARNDSVTQNRIDKRREDIDSTSTFWEYFLLKTKKNFKLTDDNVALINKRLKEYTLSQLKLAVDNFVADTWEGRKDHLDLIYCIGKQKGKPDNLEKWLNNKKGITWHKP